MPPTIRYPGVYVTEVDAFPPSIVGVETALPAFIGYTERADIGGKSMYGKPVKVASLAEFLAVFGGPYQPSFKISEVPAPANAGSVDATIIDRAAGTERYYAIKHDNAARFNLYGSIKLFYENGGGTCYIVSVGTFTDNGANTVVAKDALLAGIDACKEAEDATMLAIPDAVLLPPNSDQKWAQSNDFYDVANAMLAQCNTLKNRIALIDVYGTGHLNGETALQFQKDLNTVVSAFRAGIEADDLSYGAAYFPFLRTSAFSSIDITYRFFDHTDLKEILKTQCALLYQDAHKDAVDALIAKIDPDHHDAPADDAAIATLESELTAVLPVLKQLEDRLARTLGTLPPSAAMAGVMARVDNTKGVWNAPANVSLNSVIAPTIDITNDQQEDLNVPLDGKSICAIRSFPGRGTVPWGARTLDGNSNDWRYIQVRRTLIYIEQSIKNAMMPFVFAANDGKTWATVVSAISNFLQQTWSQGGLMGNTPSQAFSVECGLGSTMTSQDVLEGYLIVQVRVAVTHPAEFIALNFKQKIAEG